MPKISIISSIRDREPERVERWAYTLNHQSLNPEAYEIILVDLGSVDLLRESYRRISDRYKFKIHTVAYDKTFNRSLALNIGARTSDKSSSYLLFTDVDILYPRDFLEEALNCLELDNHRFVQCNLIPLPDIEFVPLGELNDSILELIAKYGTQRNCWPGTCQSMQREWFFKVRGFDESFVGWGHEDTDLRIRAEKDRLNVVILSNTVILHQHHQSCRKELRETVNWAKIVSTHSTVRNGVNWGKTDR